MKTLRTVFACFEEKAKSAQVQRAVLAAGTAFALAPVAMASEGGGSTVGDMNKLMMSFEYVTMLLEKVWQMLLGNPLLALFLAAALLTVGVRAFRKLKGAAKA